MTKQMFVFDQKSGKESKTKVFYFVVQYVVTHGNRNYKVLYLAPVLTIRLNGLPKFNFERIILPLLQDGKKLRITQLKLAKLVKLKPHSLTREPP